MKFALIILLATVSIANAQLTHDQRIGGYAMPNSSIHSQSSYMQSNEAKVGLLAGHIYRRVDGKVRNFLTDGEIIEGEIHEIDDGKIIVAEKPVINLDGTETTPLIELKNYPKEPVNGSKVLVMGIKSGTYLWNNELLEEWDCGEQLPQPEEMQIIGEVLKKRAAEQNAIAAQLQLKKFLQQSNELARLLPRATNGEAWAQTSVGVHYLTGLGCETNRDKAVYWLTQAAAGGSMEASNKLDSLK